MDKVFLAVLNMSLTASFIIIVVLLARLLLRRAPKIISYALWFVILFNLLFPFKPESSFSLIPFQANPISHDILVPGHEMNFTESAVATVNTLVPGNDQYIPVNPDTVDINETPDDGIPMTYIFDREVWLIFGSYIWIFGMAALLLFAVINYIQLKKRVSLAIRTEGNIYETDRIASPFVLGLLRPRIYIPAGMESPAYTHIIEHERTHIKRRDYLVSVAAFAALALHWFNPLVWIAYIFMLRDMESSCDESVLRRSNGDIRCEYSSAMLNFSSGKKFLSFPLAFGEQSVKARIKNVLNFKKPSRVIIVIAVILLVLLSVGFAVNRASNNNESVLPEEQPDGTYLWNGLQLIRDDIGWYGWGNVDVAVPENVITTKDRILTVSFKSRGGVYEYGFKEFIQVNLNGVWYSFTQDLPQNKERLILDTFHGQWIEDEDRTERTVDFSVIGGLPPGKYRLVETFYEERFKEETYGFAHFWVIKPGGKRPPESETEGKPRKEDIVLYVKSLYEARRDITDKDIWFGIYIENLSGKKYCMDHEKEPNPPVLEMKQNGKWVKVDYRHVNAGMMFGWTTDRNEVFLYEPLPAGRYRIRAPMYVLYESGYIELEYEFDVIAHGDAPEPKWEISKLFPSLYDASKQSKGVFMSLTNTVLNKDNPGFDVVITADKFYTFGEPYQIEVLLDGKWYGVPFASGGFNSIGYSIGFDEENKQASYPCGALFSCGILPSGRYRIIKDFTQREFLPDGWGEILAHEFAIAEFTVEEPLGSEDIYLDAWKNIE